MSGRLARLSIDPTARPELWLGAVAWREEDGWWRPWRLAPEDGRWAYAPDLFLLAQCGAGVRLSVRTDAAQLALDIDYDPLVEDDRVRAVDLVVDGTLMTRTPLGPGIATLELDLPGEACDVEVWLSQNGTTRIRNVSLTAPAPGSLAVTPASDDQPRWIAYGSSLTHCAHAGGPSETWPALIARQLSWNLTCLGFDGNCHLDPVVTRTIGRLPADVISVCLGANVMGQASFSRRTWPGQVADFLLRIREQQPSAVITVMSTIGIPSLEAAPNLVQLTLADLRDDVERVAGDLRAAGDHRLSVIHGPDVFVASDSAVLHDVLHPNAEGYRLMADRLAPVLLGAFGQGSPDR